MAWYVDLNGRQVWVEAHETVYTVLSTSDDLPEIALKYLVMTTKKASYTEHAIDDDVEKGKKKKDTTGRQRGYIVRMEERGEDRSHVISFFQDVAGKLLNSGVVSRIDVDEASGERRRKRRGQKKAEETAAVEAESEEPQIVIQHLDMTSMACNELRVLTTARCRHDAHGVGFRIEVAEDGQKQALHMFTAKQELSLDDWSARVTEAIRSAGARVMDSRVFQAALPTDAEGRLVEGGSKSKVDEAQIDEDDWLKAMMGTCKVEQKKEEPIKQSENGVKDEGKDESKPTPTPSGEIPPWLQRRRRKKDVGDEAQ